MGRRRATMLVGLLCLSVPVKALAQWGDPKLIAGQVGFNVALSFLGKVLLEREPPRRAIKEALKEGSMSGLVAHAGYSIGGRNPEWALVGKALAQKSILLTRRSMNNEPVFDETLWTHWELTHSFVHIKWSGEAPSVQIDAVNTAFSTYYLGAHALLRSHQMERRGSERSNRRGQYGLLDLLSARGRPISVRRKTIPPQRKSRLRQSRPSRSCTRLLRAGHNLGRRRTPGRPACPRSRNRPQLPSGTRLLDQRVAGGRFSNQLAELRLRRSRATRGLARPRQPRSRDRSGLLLPHRSLTRFDTRAGGFRVFAGLEPRPRPANDERGCKREKAEFARSGIQAVLIVVQLPSYTAG